MDIDILNTERVMIIIRHKAEFDVKLVCEAVWSAGLHIIEFTLNTPGVFKLLSAAAVNFRENIVLGAGTVLSIDGVKQAVDAGAAFIVSPVCDTPVIEYCVKHSLPVFPGAFTPTEIYTAFRAGAYMVKVYPASGLSPQYFQSLKGPLPELKLMAVGGVNAENIPDYFTAGAAAVGVGAGTVRPEWIDAGDYQKIVDNVRRLKEAVAHGAINKDTRIRS